MVQKSKDYDASTEQAAEGEPEEEPVNDDNMATMPIPKLVASLRDPKHYGDQFLLQLTMSTIANRLMAEYERAEARFPLAGAPVDQKMYNEACARVMELEERIKNCFALGTGSCK